MVRDQEVDGSNPFAPTTSFAEVPRPLRPYLFVLSRTAMVAAMDTAPL